MQHQIVESWQIHNRIHLYLLDAIPDEALTAPLTTKGRTPGEQFVHIHNVRLMWLKAANPVLLETVTKLDKESFTKPALQEAFTKSGEAISTLLEEALNTDGRVKNFKPHATAFFAYLISHESHHRGQIAMTLRQSGHPLDKKTGFGMWEWGVR